MVGVLFVAGSAQDELLYHSDPFSFTSLILGLALVVFLVLLTVAFVGGRVPTLVPTGRVFAEWLPLALIVTSFVIFGYEWRVGPIVSPAGFWAASGATLLATFALVALLPDRAARRARLAQLNRLVFAVGNVTLAACCATSFAPRAWRSIVGGSTPRHAVVIVIDGLPTATLQTYRPEAEQTAMDRVLTEGRVFREARTNKVYTSGYFKALLTGQLDESAAPNGPNLFGALQAHGVKTRWISFHSNGIPESNGITDYRGLRSALLTERFAWFPRLLGLDYNIFVVWNTTRQSMGRRLDALYTRLNGRTDEERLWQQVVPAEVRELRRTADRSLLLIHVSVTKQPVQSQEAGNDDDADENVAELYKRALASEYTYEPSDEPVMAVVRTQYRLRVDAYGRWVAGLLKIMKESGALNDTIVVVTADHGSSLDHSKIWYGFHPDEQVTRVPLAIIGAGLGGQSIDHVDTLDVARTVATYFGVAGDFASTGRSLLGPLSNRTIPVLTIASGVRAEQFLVLYDSENKYIFNVFPAGKAQRTMYRLSGYETLEGERPIREDDPMWDEFGSAARALGLTPKSVHSSFASRLKPKLGTPGPAFDWR